MESATDKLPPVPTTTGPALPCIEARIVLPGHLFTRPTNREGVEWALIGRTPRVLIANPAEVYQLRVDQSATDDDLAGVAAFESLPSALWLDLHGCEQITAVGVAHLAGLSRLRSLDLRWCPAVDDDAVAQLGKAGWLRELYLLGCPLVTRQGREALAAALPECQISW